MTDSFAERGSGPSRRGATALFLVLTIGLLAAAGTLAVSLPPVVRRPVVMPVLLFGVGGGLLIGWLRTLLEVRLRSWTLIALLAIAPTAYAIAGVRALDEAYERRGRSEDQIIGGLFRQIAEQQDAAPLDLSARKKMTQTDPGPLRWAAWRWEATPLGAFAGLAMLAYLLEAAAAVAVGWRIARHTRPGAAAPVSSRE